MEKVCVTVMTTGGFCYPDNEARLPDGAVETSCAKHPALPHRSTSRLQHLQARRPRARRQGFSPLRGTPMHHAPKFRGRSLSCQRSFAIRCVITTALGRRPLPGAGRSSHPDAQAGVSPGPCSTTCVVRARHAGRGRADTRRYDAVPGNRPCLQGRIHTGNDSPVVSGPRIPWHSVPLQRTGGAGGHRAGPVRGHAGVTAPSGHDHEFVRQAPFRGPSDPAHTPSIGGGRRTAAPAVVVAQGHPDEQLARPEAPLGLPSRASGDGEAAPQQLPIPAGAAAAPRAAPPQWRRRRQRPARRALRRGGGRRSVAPADRRITVASGRGSLDRAAWASRS